MVGLGNGLSTYCYYYLDSLHNNLDFDIAKSLNSINWKRKGQEMLRLYEKDLLLKHLPLLLPHNPNIKVDASISIKENTDFCGLFYHMKMYGMLENILHLRPILHDAIQKFSDIKFNFHPNDVVIHFRTGDIFSNKHEAFYSSIHFSNYLNLLKSRTINNIYIVWKSDRKQDKVYDTYNKVIINHLKKYLITNLDLKLNKVIVDRQHIDDFVFMTQAPFLIACISTYSMWGALLNTNSAIIPQCKNHFNNRLYDGDHFKIISMKTVNKYKKDIGEFCDQFTK